MDGVHQTTLDAPGLLQNTHTASDKPIVVHEAQATRSIEGLYVSSFKQIRRQCNSQLHCSQRRM